MKKNELEKKGKKEKTKTPLLVNRVRVILIGGLFFQIFDIVFAQLFNFPYLAVFFFNFGTLTNLIFLLLGNFTNSDRTPPYIDTYLKLFPNFGNSGKNALR